MDTRWIPCYYCAFILFGIHVVHGDTVLPPTNVSLHCHNMQNTLSWMYDHSAPGLRFKVSVLATNSNSSTHWVDWPKKSVDLSKYSVPEDNYVVFVSAVLGTGSSDEVPEEGIEYSYFKDSPATIKCSLDLPAVTVTTSEENHIDFSFPHPGLKYLTHRRSRRKKSYDSQSGLDLFEYNIMAINQESLKYVSKSDNCAEEECKGEIHVDDVEKSHCLTISGEMRKMSVQSTQKYCSVPKAPDGINPLAYAIPIVLLLVGGVLIVIMVVIKKTRTSSQDPSALMNVRNVFPRTYAAPDPSDIDIVEPSSPEPLLTPDQNTSNGGSSIHRDELRLPIGVYERRNQPDEEMPGGQQDVTENGYSQGNRLEQDEEEEEDEESARAYERRPAPV